MSTTIVNIIYLIASVLFIFGLKGLTHPKTAVRGNLLGAVGMFLAVLVTLLDRNIVSFEIIAVGLIVGASIGVFLAVKIKMTDMPQLVGLFNGFGGAASVLVASAALIEVVLVTKTPAAQITIATVASGLIGSVTFWGSMVACGKLQGLVTDKPVRYKGEQFVKITLLLGCIVAGALIVTNPEAIHYYWILVALASVLGVMLVMPIGGADMPVVIALLNSYSGLAATATGFVLQNNVLIIAGSLVGASGIILTNIMCKAMNRSLANVLFGGFGEVDVIEDVDDIYAGKIK